MEKDSNINLNIESIQQDIINKLKEIGTPTEYLGYIELETLENFTKRYGQFIVHDHNLSDFNFILYGHSNGIVECTAGIKDLSDEDELIKCINFIGSYYGATKTLKNLPKQFNVSWEE